MKENNANPNFFTNGYLVTKLITFRGGKSHYTKIFLSVFMFRFSSKTNLLRKSLCTDLRWEIAQRCSAFLVSVQICVFGENRNVATGEEIWPDKNLESFRPFSYGFHLWPDKKFLNKTLCSTVPGGPAWGPGQTSSLPQQVPVYFKTLEF